MKFLVLAHPGDITAIRAAEALQDRYGSAAARVVSMEEIALAPRFTHTVEEDRVETTLVLHDGEVIRSDHIGVVFNRLQYVAPPRFARASEADRGYAAMEMSALLLSWLAGLTCPVVNRVSPQGMAGASHPAVWQALAGKAGLPALRLRLTTSRRRFPDEGLVALISENGRAGPGQVSPAFLPSGQPAWLVEPVGAHASSVLVVGNRILGDLPPGALEPCRRLAALSGLLFVRLFFSSSPDTADARLFTGADPFPHVNDEESLVSLVRLLESLAAGRA